MNINKQKFALILAFGLPLILVITIAAFVYLPSLFIQTPKQFFYTTNYDYNSQYTYSVSGNRITEDYNKDYYYDSYNTKNGIDTKAKLYLYDATTGKAREISYSEARGYNISDSVDGWTVGESTNYGGFFASSSYGQVYLKGHGVTKKINLAGISSYDFKFLGFVSN